MSFDPLHDVVSPAAELPQSYWLSTAALPGYPALKSDSTTDYLVIGGGYTGLSCALSLAEAGTDVMCIDARDIGFGCAGRNAGFVLTGTGRLGIDAIARKWGDVIAQGMQDEFSQAVALLNERVTRFNIDCDLQDGPYYKIAHSSKSAATLKAAAQKNKLSFLSIDKLNNELVMDNAFGASKQPGQTLNPLKLAIGLAHAAVEKGARLHGQTPALDIQQQAGHYQVTTPQGVVKARKVLIATNAYTPPVFNRYVDKRQFPVQSSILVTKPLTRGQQDATGLNRPMSMMDTRMMKYYYRTLPDGRVLFGGRGAVTGRKANHQSEKQRLFNAMISSFPALADTAIDYFWSGWVSVALDSLPRIHTAENNTLGYAMGYCGSGVSFAGLAGTRLAQRMLGGEHAEAMNETLPLYTTPLPRYPFAGLRRMGLRALYTWAKFAE